MLSRVRLFATPWAAAHQASLSFTISLSLLKLTSIKSVMPPSHLILCHPFSSCPQSFPVSGSYPMSQLFASGSQSIGTSASRISPSNEYLGLISFMIDWFDLLAVQGTLKSLLQHHSSKASIFFALSVLYDPTVIFAYATGKTIALTRQTFLEMCCLCFLIHC